MRAFMSRSLVAAAFTAALVAMAGCPGAKVPGSPSVPSAPGGLPGGSSGEVDPNTCGNYAVTDAGRKLKAFLEATVELQKTVQETEEVVKTSCKMMGGELKMAPATLEGATKDVCDRVFAELKNDLKLGIKSQAALVIQYKPAVCTVDVDAEAHAAAECEAQASGSAKVTCGGTCTGTCDGTCKGTCEGGSAGGKCKGQCKGTCEGSCSGGCTGQSDVHASAQCKANAEVHASVNAQCTEPELKITVQKPLVIDASKAELAINAMMKGLPKILSVKERLKPLNGAVTSWVTAATELSRSGHDLASSFKDQAICISGQIAAAVNAITHIQASVSVSVSVSVEASGSVGAK